MCSRLNADPESIRRTIDSVTLPAWFDPVFDQYERTAGDRDRILWKWLYHIIPTFQLSSVPERYAESARNANFGMSVYMTILDDITEQHCNRPLFEEARQIPFSNTAAWTSTDDTEREICSLLDRVWEQTESFLSEGPRADEFREMLEFDLRQSLNTMEYTRLVSADPRIATPQSIERHDVYNMLLFIYTDIDLAFSPGFDQDEFAAFRELVWDAQRLARISNWVTTWEREIREGDYTSKVVLCAIERGVVPIETLETAPQEAIEHIRNADIESELLAEWNQRYDTLRSADPTVSTVDTAAFIEGMRYIRVVDQALEGHK